MVKDEDDKNSICSNEEEVEVKDKETPKKKVLKKVVKYVIGNENDSNEDEIEPEEDEVEDEEADEEDDEEADEDEEEDDEEEDDDDDEYDPTIIQFEMLKNFFVDEDGTNVATHLGSISKELRTLNKILLKKNKE